MQNLILSPIGVSDLVGMIANEIESRMISREKNLQPTTEPKRIIGDRALANYLGCSTLTVGKLRRSREITSHRFGRKYYYLSNEIDAELKVEARRFGEKVRVKR